MLLRFLERKTGLRSRVIRAGCIDYVAIFRNNLFHAHPEESTVRNYINELIINKSVHISRDGNNSRDSEARPRGGLFHATEIGDDRAFLRTIDERIAEKSGTFAEERKETKMWDVAFFPLCK